MKINSISYSYNPNFRADDKTKVSTPENKETEKKPIKISLKKESYTKNELYTIMGATAIFSTVLGGALISAGSLRMGRSARAQVRILEESAQNLRKELDNLTKSNDSIKELNAGLKNSLKNVKTKLDDLVESGLTPAEIRERIAQSINSKINEGSLDYDVMSPPVTGKGTRKVYDDAIDLPDVPRTLNRNSMTELDIPEIGRDGSFSFTIPRSSEMKISNMPRKEFTPIINAQTSITESYADSLNWDDAKIARDILQNFFDGHGQTLDGVKITFSPSGGKYKVRITGDSTYTVDKAIYLGESTKRDNARAAGNFGEGLKMCALKLLKDYGASDVKIASDNWKLSFSLRDTKLTDKRVLSYDLEKVSDAYKGNYVEFETDSKQFLSTLRDSINRFYHSGNPHFKCPDFENDIVGVKLLSPDENGAIYIAGQRFEFENSYDGLNGVVLFVKEKPSKDYLDISRDRCSLSSGELGMLSAWLAHNDKMSLDDKLKFFRTFERYWAHEACDYSNQMRMVVPMFANGLKNKAIHINFPSNYIAFSPATKELVSDLRMAGYKVCDKSFAELGMQTIRDIMGDARAHDVVMPSDAQLRKIRILKEAIDTFKPTLEGKYFSPEELNTRVYMFDRNAAKERKMYSGTKAEAITDAKESKGFWIDKTYLEESQFGEALETALHEMSHKAGGDESQEFSYMLTSVNEGVLKQLSTDAETRQRLQILSSLWDA